VTNALSAIGLTCDIVGAVTLTLGLFRRPRALFPGWVSGPDETARDQAFGVAGASLLVLGFFGQILPDFGTRWEVTTHRAIFTAAMAFLAAVLVSLCIYSAALLASYRHARRWAECLQAGTGGEVGYPWHFAWRPRLWPFRLWAIVSDETGQEPG
jgi:hypothetical protein